MRALSPVAPLAPARRRDLRSGGRPGNRTQDASERAAVFETVSSSVPGAFRERAGRVRRSRVRLLHEPQPDAAAPSGLPRRSGAGGWSRTNDAGLFRTPLYRLSYSCVKWTPGRGSNPRSPGCSRRHTPSLPPGVEVLRSTARAAALGPIGCQVTRPSREVVARRGVEPRPHRLRAWHAASNTCGLRSGREPRSRTWCLAPPRRACHRCTSPR